MGKLCGDLCSGYGGPSPLLFHKGLSIKGTFTRTALRDDVLIFAHNPDPSMLTEQPQLKYSHFRAAFCRDCTVVFWCTCVLSNGKNLVCFRRADSLNGTCNWISICLLHLLYSHLRAKRRGCWRTGQFLAVPA